MLRNWVYRFFDRYFPVLLVLFALTSVGVVVLQVRGQTVRPRVEAPPYRFVISSAAGSVGGQNKADITVTVQDSNGNPISAVPFDIYFSDSATCQGLTATASSGTVGILTSTGTLVSIATGVFGTPLNTSTLVQTQGGSTLAFNRVMGNNVGAVTLEVTDSAKTNWFPCAFYEPGRIRGIGTQLVTASFSTIVLPYNSVGYWWEYTEKWLKKLLGIDQSDAAFLEKIPGHDFVFRLWAYLWWILGSGGWIFATAPVPRIKKIGAMVFARNAYGIDLFGPQGGLPLEDYDEVWMDFSGTLTISGGTVSGVPVIENPDTLLKSVEVKVTGTTLADSFKELPAVSLQKLNMVCDSAGTYPRGNAGVMSDVDAAFPPFIARTPIGSGEIGTYSFRNFVRIPFSNQGMANPYKFFFPSNRYGQVNIRIRFGSEEDLVAGGNRTKAISNSQIIFYGVSYSFDTDYDLVSELYFNQMIAVKTVAVPNQLQVDQDYEIIRTAAFLKSVLIEQFTIDANGVETPTDQGIRPTDQVVVRLNDESSKAENMTWELWRFLNASWYLRPLPLGAILIDFSYRGDEGLVRKMQMMNFTSIKIRANNAAVANLNIRFTVNKFAVAA